MALTIFLSAFHGIIFGHFVRDRRHFPFRMNKVISGPARFDPEQIVLTFGLPPPLHLSSSFSISPFLEERVIFYHFHFADVEWILNPSRPGTIWSTSQL
jgi:hypothetical protein